MVFTPSLIFDLNGGHFSQTKPTGIFENETCWDFRCSQFEPRILAIRVVNVRCRDANCLISHCQLPPSVFPAFASHTSDFHRRHLQAPPSVCPIFVDIQIPAPHSPNPTFSSQLFTFKISKAVDFGNCLISASQQSSVQVGGFPTIIGPEAAGCKPAISHRHLARFGSRVLLKNH